MNNNISIASLVSAVIMTIGVTVALALYGIAGIMFGAWIGGVAFVDRIRRLTRMGVAPQPIVVMSNWRPGQNAGAATRAL